MLIVDDILFFPVKGIFWIFREIHNAAQQELASEAENITTELSELYMMLETGKITEDEFDLREKALLDRLDEIQADASQIEDEEEDDTEEEDFGEEEEEEESSQGSDS